MDNADAMKSDQRYGFVADSAKAAFSTIGRREASTDGVGRVRRAVGDEVHN